MTRTSLACAALIASLVAAAPARAEKHVAAGIKSFEGIEEPELCYDVAKGTFRFDDFANITDIGDNTVRFRLRYGPQWWDGDRDKDDATRQRAEVKGLGPHQKLGETFEYATTWRTNPTFKGSGRFCHIFQLKATEGDRGAPLVVVSILEGQAAAALRYWPGGADGFITARTFQWAPDAWQTLRIRIRTSIRKEGEVAVSVNGDDFQGARNVPVFRPDAADYRPKWGLYRGLAKGLSIGDDFVDHKNASAEKR